MTYKEKRLEEFYERLKEFVPANTEEDIYMLAEDFRDFLAISIDTYNTELKEKIINSPKTFGLTDKEGRCGAILVEDILDILSLEDKLNK